MRPLVYLLVQYAQITLKAFFWRFDARKRYSISVVSQTHYNSLQAYYKLITSNATVILLCNETYYNAITKPKERGSFNVLAHTFRHGMGTKDKMDKHKACTEAVAIIVQYDFDNGHPPFEVDGTILS